MRLPSCALSRTPTQTGDGHKVMDEWPQRALLLRLPGRMWRMAATRRMWRVEVTSSYTGRESVSSWAVMEAERQSVPLTDLPISIHYRSTS